MRVRTSLPINLRHILPNQRFIDTNVVAVGDSAKCSLLSKHESKEIGARVNLDCRDTGVYFIWN